MTRVSFLKFIQDPSYLWPHHYFLHREHQAAGRLATWFFFVAGFARHGLTVYPSLILDSWRSCLSLPGMYHHVDFSEGLKSMKVSSIWLTWMRRSGSCRDTLEHVGKEKSIRRNHSLRLLHFSNQNPKRTTCGGKVYLARKFRGI